MAIILVGLIGSSMFVTEKTDYVAFDEEADTAENFVIDDYELRYTGSDVETMPNGDDILYRVEFDVYDVNTGAYIGHVNPSVQLVASTQQTKLNASVISFPTEDLFVVYRGVNDAGDLSMDVRVNPLVSFAWVGFALLMLGTAIALFGRRKDGEVSSVSKKESRGEGVDGASDEEEAREQATA